MKICKLPFEFFYVGPHGNINLCAWTELTVGNLLENDLMDIWHSDSAEKLRTSILDGSFYYCNCDSCPYLSGDTLPDLTEEEVQQLKAAVKEGPKRLSLAYDFTCNHKCPSCRDEIYKPCLEEKEELRHITERVYPYINKMKEVMSNGMGELFTSAYIMKLLENLKPEKSDFVLTIETNGALFDEENWNKIKHLSAYDIKVIVTPNSFDKEVYRYLAGGDDAYDHLDILLANLRYLSQLRRQEYINDLQVNIVMQESNFREVPSFCQRALEEFSADRVAIKPINRWFGLPAGVFWFKDILNPFHPYHQEYIRMKQDCRLKDERVWDWTGGNNHKAKQHPAYQYQVFFELFYQLLECDNPKSAISQYLKQKGVTTVAIYGAYDVGGKLCRLLDNTEVEVVYFIDKFQFKGTYCGREIQPLYQRDHNRVPCILVAPIMEFEKIKSDLRQEGYGGNIWSLEEVIHNLRKEK